MWGGIHSAVVLGAVEGSLLAAVAARVWWEDRESNLTTGYTTPRSDTPDPSLSFAEPLAPSGASLCSQGSPYSLLASWDEATGEGYVVALGAAEQPVKNSSLLRGVTNFTYEGLRPGTLYTFEVSTVAGPYTSSPRRITNWTCECHSPHGSQPRGSHWVLPFPMVSCRRACDSAGLLQLRAVKWQKDQESRDAAGCVLLWSVPQSPSTRVSRAQHPPPPPSGHAPVALLRLPLPPITCPLPWPRPSHLLQLQGSPPSPCQSERRAGPVLA